MGRIPVGCAEVIVVSYSPIGARDEQVYAFVPRELISHAIFHDQGSSASMTTMTMADGRRVQGLMCRSVDDALRAMAVASGEEPPADAAPCAEPEAPSAVGARCRYCDLANCAIYAHQGQLRRDLACPPPAHGGMSDVDAAGTGGMSDMSLDLEKQAEEQPENSQGTEAPANDDTASENFTNSLAEMGSPDPMPREEQDDTFFMHASENKGFRHWSKRG